MRRRKLCFTCQEYWAPRHKCAAGKAHDIEVFSNDEEEEEEEKRRDHNTDIEGDDPPPHGGEDEATIRSTLSSIRVIPNYHETSTQ